MDIILKSILIITFVVLFPLGEVARIQLAKGVALTALDIGVIFLVLFAIPRLLITSKKLNFVFVKEIIFFLIICLFSLLIHMVILTQQEFFVAFLYLVRFSCYIAMYVVVSSFDETFKKRFVVLFLICGIEMIAIGYVQYFFYPSLRNLYYLGWDPHESRMFGSLLDPNFFGAFLALYFLFLLHTLFTFTKGFAHLKNNFTKSKKPVFLILLLVVTCISIILTYSRSTYVMFAVGIVTYLLMQRQKRLLLVSAICLLLVSSLLFIVTANRTEGTRVFRVSSTKARLDSSYQALTVFQKNPVFGVGFDAYRYALKRYHLSDPQDIDVSHAAAGTDNSFLFVLATTGLVGFFSFLFLWKNILSFSFQNKHVLLFASTIGLLLNSLFINSLFYPFILFWFWSMVGAMD